MGLFAAGQVVLLPFPFSDLTRNKVRPSLLLAESTDDDWIACQITSNPKRDGRAIAIAREHFSDGGLRAVSYVRPGKLFTAHESKFSEYLGTLNQPTLARVRNTLIEMLLAATESA